MLVIRLQRIGKKHQPSYRLVVAERRSKLGAPPVEDLGSYNPFSKAFGVKKERVAYWLSKGAQPTATTWNLMVSQKVVEGKKKIVKVNKQVVSDTPKKAETKAEASEKVEATEPEKAEAPSETEAPSA